MNRKHPKRFADDEMDQDGTLEEGNPYSRPHSRGRRRTPRVPKWVYRVVVILALCVAGMLLWFNRANLTPENILEWMQVQTVGMGVGDGYPTPIVGSSVEKGNFYCRNKDLYVLSDTRLTVLNSTARELVSRQHSFGAPAMKSAGSRVMVYNIGGTGYQIEGFSDTLFSGNTEENIFTADISGNGKYALVTEDRGYCAKLTVYFPDHTEQYSYEFADYYITDISLNRDGSRAAACGISAQNGAVVSAVYFFDFNNPAAETVVTFDSTTLLDVEYCENGSVIAVGDTMLSVVSSDGEHTDYSFQGQRISAYAVDNGRVLLALMPYENSISSRLVIVGENGQETMSAELAYPVSSVSLYGDTAAALANSQIYFYTVSTGAVLGEADSGSDARAIALMDEQNAYVLGVSEIRRAAVP